MMILKSEPKHDDSDNFDDDDDDDDDDDYEYGSDTSRKAKHFLCVFIQCCHLNTSLIVMYSNDNIA